MKKTSAILLLGVSLLLLCLVYPVSAVGVFRNSEGNWYLDYNNTGVIDKTFRYGGVGDAPVVGNWQGTERDGIGIFRPSTGYWYLDCNLDGVVDKSFRFGGSTDRIIKGDWDGDGKDGIAIFRPSTGYWYFDYNLDGIIDNSFRFGGSTDQIIKGDWQGTGRDGIAIFRPSTGYWYFDYNLDGVVDTSFRYGGSTDRIIKGDWQGTGRDGIAIFRPSTGYWYFDYNLDGIVDKSFRYGGSTDQIIDGDMQGTGRDGIAIFRPSTGYWYFDYNLDGVVDKSFRYGGGNDNIMVGKWISVAPVAAFTSDVQSGNAPLTVRFTNQSTGTSPLSYAWDFNNDGNVDSSEPSPVYLYTVPGTYTVKLTASNGAGSSSEQKAGYITVTQAPVAPAAAFTANVQSGYAPLTVRFTDQSTGTAPLVYAWDFTNDGVNDSTTQSPSFTYPAAGTYSVRLTATNAAGSDAEIKTSYITVSPAPIAPAAAFISSTQAGTAPLTVSFTDRSTGTGPLTYAWDFTNDWDDESYQQNPSYTYSTAGIYTVKLTVTNAAGSDEEIKTGYITVTELPAAPTAAFTSNKHTGTAPLTVKFTDESTGTAPLVYAWDFTNDGEDDSVLSNPTFTYETPGTYTVKLTVTNSLGTDVERKTGYITVTESQPGGSRAGIALTFDDESIDQWYAIRGMLHQYNAHVTFFVTNFGNLDQGQIDKLRTLQGDGHEIAFHGAHHTEAATYLQTHTIQQYLDYDIIPGINLMKNAGFDPVDFAYPGGSDTPAATLALQGYFGHIRDTHYSWDDAIYYEYGSDQAFITGIGIDDLTYGNSINDIYNGISRAKTDDTILITYGHIPVQTVTGDYQTSYDRLEKILINVTENDMKFYTVSELT